MSELTCPVCQATFDVDSDRPALPDECPFCGTDLTNLAAGLPPPTRAYRAPLGSESETPAPRSLPADSKIVMLTPEPGQLIFQIPPGKGGAAGFLLFFGIFWLALTSIIAAIFAFAGNENPDPGSWMLIPFFGVFFLIGFGVLIGGMAMKYLQTMLLIERHRAVMQKSLFRYETYHEMPLGEGAHATLVESYRQNEQPVYAVAIVSGGKSFKFGTSLTDAEKCSLLGLINGHLGYETIETVAEAKNPILAESKPAEEVAPGDLSPATLVRIEQQRVDELVMSFALIPSSAFTMFSRLVVAGMGVFAVAMAIFVGFAFGRVGGGFPPIVLIPFVMFFFLPFGVALLLLRVRVTIGINSEHVIHQIASGPFRRKKTRTAMSVTGVTIRSHVVKSKSSRRRQTGSVTILWSYVTLDIGEQQNWLAFGPEQPFCREVAGLLKYQLRRVGNRQVDVPAFEPPPLVESTDVDD